VHDANPVGQVVDEDIPAGKGRQFGLNLNTDNPHAGVAMGKDQGDDSAAAAEIEQGIMEPGFEEMRRQHCINGVAIPLPELPADQSSVKEGIIAEKAGPGFQPPRPAR